MKDLATVAGVIILLVNSGTQAVANKLQDVCPTIFVTCAPKSCYKSPFYFTAGTIKVQAHRKLRYQWTVTVGAIVRGQGTRSIKVVTAPKWRDLTAQLKVTGLPAGCGSTASMSVIQEEPFRAQLFDQFAPAPLAKVGTHLDRFADELRGKPGARGFILSHGDHRLAESAKNYLIDRHGIAADRIVNVRQKRGRRPAIKLYIVPTGAAPPG